VAETFLVDHARENGSAVVRFIGELDLSGAAHAKEAGIAAVSALDSDGSTLIIDLSELAFCDSSGLHALVAIRDQAEATNHVVVLRRPQRLLRRVLQLTGLDESFTIDD
jgi:anti-sigma B factor antagonist